MHGGAITELLQRHQLGDREAFDQVVPLVYDYLRRIARSQLARGWPSDTLDTTALVHEAYLQLAAETGISVNDRDHFYALCARVMRRILVDHARHVSAQKRSAGGPRVPLFKVYRAVRENNRDGTYDLFSWNYNDALEYAIENSVPSLSACEQTGYNGYAEWNGLF